MKSAFIPEDQSDLNPNHLNKTTTIIDAENLLTPPTDEQAQNLKSLKKQSLSKKKTANIVILILGNLAVILLLLFIYFSL